MNHFLFADLLTGHVERMGYTMGQLARRAGLPKQTVTNWVNGRVSKPRHVDDVIRLATALHLLAAQADELLIAAGFAPLAQVQSDQPELAGLLGTPAAPFQAPGDLPYFIGRNRDIEAVQKILLEEGMCCITGMGGLGKTSLAIRLAHRLKPEFPDGVLWARLSHTDPMLILSNFARAYGMDVDHYRALEGRSQAVRSLLAHKHVLIVLDDVQSSDQVEPLLPGSGLNAVLITTRRHDLAVSLGRSGYKPGAFDATETLSLFQRFYQVTKPDDESILQAIGDTLEHLPLAVTIAASRLACEPHWSPAAFLERLQHSRLPQLNFERQSVRLSFSASYERLSAEQQRCFAAMSVFANHPFTPTAAAAVLDCPLETAQDTLRSLTLLSLIQPNSRERYWLHPLLYDYAAEQAQLHADYPLWRQRLANYYGDFVHARRDDYDHLFEEGQALLLHVAEVADTDDLKSAYIRLIRGLTFYLGYYVYQPLAKTLYERAVSHARTVHDQTSLSHLLFHLGRTYWVLNEDEKSMTTLMEAAILGRLHHDPVQVARCLAEWVAVVGVSATPHPQAQGYVAELDGLLPQLDSERMQATVLLNTGVWAFYHQSLADAKDRFCRALTISRRIQDDTLTSTLLINLGEVAKLTFQDGDAAAYFGLALQMIEANNRDEQMFAMLYNNMGEMSLRQGKFIQARQQFQAGLEYARRTGYERMKFTLLCNSGDLAVCTAQLADARAYFKEALGNVQDTTATEFLKQSLAALDTGRNPVAEAFYQEGIRWVREGKR